MDDKIKLAKCSFVARGSFTPALFSPQWFKSENFISSEEEKASQIRLIHEEVSQFLASNIFVEVYRDALKFTPQDERYFESCRDLIVNIFSALSRTPVGTFGINHDFHFGVASEEKWHLIGDSLVPKKFWERPLQNPAMRSLTVEAKSPFGENSRIGVTIEPSNQNIPHGVYVQVNTHFNISNEEEILKQTSMLVNSTKSYWQDIHENSKKILQNVMEIEK